MQARVVKSVTYIAFRPSPSRTPLTDNMGSGHVEYCVCPRSLMKALKPLFGTRFTVTDRKTID